MDEADSKKNQPQGQESEVTSSPASEGASEIIEPVDESTPLETTTPPPEQPLNVAAASASPEQHRFFEWIKRDGIRNLQIANTVLATTAVVTCVFTLFEFRELQRQGELTRQSLDLTKQSLGLTQDGLKATNESNTIAARAASAAEEQARLTRDQLRQGAAQVELSRRANAITVENSREERRAWLTIKSAAVVTLIPGQPVDVLLHITNSGLTPALEVRIASNVHGAESFRTSDKPAQQDSDWSTMIIAPGMTSTSMARLDQPLTDGGWLAFREGRTRLFASGSIYYRDVFGRKHETRFCSSLGSAHLEMYANKRIDRLEMVACPEHNEAR